MVVWAAIVATWLPPTVAAMNGEPVDSFPRESARTQRYTLGEPRNVLVSPDGRRIVFLRSRRGTDPVNCLWVLDAATGEERLVADPAVLLGERRSDELPPEERARRERAREAAGGITAFATNSDVTVAAFALAGPAVRGRTAQRQRPRASCRRAGLRPAARSRRPDAWPTSAGACSHRRARRPLAGARRRRGRRPETVTWGSADFIAAEEMGRQPGFWWSPDGDARRDPRRHVTGAALVHQRPCQPRPRPTETAYPAAGTTNAGVVAARRRISTASTVDGRLGP